MLPATLDLVFPYVCFAYGAMVTFVLHSPRLMRLAEERMPTDHVERLVGHRILAQLCLWVGAAWILQNLWFA